MIQSGFLFLALCSGVVPSVHGYADTPAFVAKQTGKKFSRPWFDALGGEEYGFGAIRGLLEVNRELERSMSMSISMSYDYDAKPTFPKSPSPVSSPAGVSGTGSPAAPSSNLPSAIIAPTTPAASPMPTTTSGPTVTAQPTLSSIPSESPSASSAPSTSLHPTVSPPSAAPTTLAPVTVSTGAPTAMPIDISTGDVVGIYECTNQGVALSDDIANITTLINLSVAYAAEVNDTKLSPDAIKALEAALLQVAIGATLDCGGASNRLLQQQQDRELLATTDTLGPCNATVDDASCFVLETDLAFVLNKEVNPQYVAYLAYLSMKDGMTNGTFSKDIEQIFKLTYLAPLPLVPPPNTTQPLGVNDESEAPPEGRRTNNWTIGACIAMSTGGLLALGAWFYKRRYQNKRHIELDDDRSDAPGSLFSAERDFMEDA